MMKSFFSFWISIAVSVEEESNSIAEETDVKPTVSFDMMQSSSSPSSRATADLGERP